MRLIVTLLLLALPLYGAERVAHAGLSIELDKYEVAGEKLVVATIHGPALWNTGKKDPRSQELAEVLLHKAEDFIYGQYRERYPHLPDAFFDEMRKLNPSGAEGAVHVIAFPEDNPEEIAGSLKISYKIPGLIPMPLEKLTGLDLPREYRRMTTAEAKNTFNKQLPPPAFALMLAGTAELGNFVKNKKAERYVIPLLWEVALRREVTEVSIPVNRGRLMSIETFPASYKLVCDERMIPYYERLGFTKFLPDPIKGNYVMVADNLTFNTVAQKKMWDSADIKEKVADRKFIPEGGWEKIDRLTKGHGKKALYDYFGVSPCTAIIKTLTD